MTQEIWLLKKQRNTKLLATKLYSRTPTSGTVGLPNSPTTPQWDVEGHCEKPWETGAGKGGEGRQDEEMDLCRGPS